MLQPVDAGRRHRATSMLRRATATLVPSRCMASMYSTSIVLGGVRAIQHMAVIRGGDHASHDVDSSSEARVSSSDTAHDSCRQLMIADSSGEGFESRRKLIGRLFSALEKLGEDGGDHASHDADSSSEGFESRRVIRRTRADE